VFAVVGEGFLPTGCPCFQLCLFVWLAEYCTKHKIRMEV